MSTAKQDILDSIRRNTEFKEPFPDLKNFKGITYEDKVEQFRQILVTVGGAVVDWPEGKTLGEMLKENFPEATRYVSDEPIEGIETYNPDSVEAPGDMNGTDVAILYSNIGVCENGACWINQEDHYRAQFFISENLAIILDRKDLVNNMHEAYRKVAEINPKSVFSTFISGPSKTADIEQALVMGAHGARGVKIFLK